jgi:hypothetical protein
MTPEERKAAADAMRAEVEADRASRPVKVEAPRPITYDNGKAAELPVTRVTDQNRQGDGPQGTPVPRTTGIIESAVKDIEDRKQKDLDALNESNRALGLPEKKK